jgi:2,3-bisphosphoglycerate-independent phosphoglycerate mutase
VEVVDRCIGQIVERVRQLGGAVLITADHGNCERMIADDGTPVTAHTLTRVPFVYVGRPATVAADGALQDIAPTMLALMGLPQPPEMTGKSLVGLAKR